MILTPFVAVVNNLARADLFIIFRGGVVEAPWRTGGSVGADGSRRWSAGRSEVVARLAEGLAGEGWWEEDGAGHGAGWWRGWPKGLAGEGRWEEDGAGHGAGWWRAKAADDGAVGRAKGEASTARARR
jgi:hypothetical protein